MALRISMLFPGKVRKKALQAFVAKDPGKTGIRIDDFLTRQLNHKQANIRIFKQADQVFHIMQNDCDWLKSFLF